MKNLTSYDKLFEFVNKEGKEYFTNVRRTNHFVVLTVSSFSGEYEVKERLKRIKQIKFMKFQEGEVWLRIGSSLNKFMRKLNGEVEVLPFDNFDKELWLWYIENETPFRYRWMMLFIWMFFWRRW